VVVAFIGWLDDRHGLSIKVRLCTHAVAALWAVSWLGGLKTVDLGVTQFPLGILGAPLAMIGIVWFTNLYNFMDGIDGLAGMQAFVVAVAAGCFTFAEAQPVALACWLLAAAVGGFLYWNWPAASIFMGDVGSGTLGFFFAVLALANEGSGTLPLLVWLILLGPFLVDATSTLVLRFCQGKKWYLGHRSHAYQRAVQSGHSHTRVTITIFFIDLFLVLLATVGLLRPSVLLPILLSVLASLFALWYYFTGVRQVELIGDEMM
jgi:Fuc2NAc and GlcNAc transferase